MTKIQYKHNEAVKLFNMKRKRKTQKTNSIRFSDYFKLGKSQSELDFVDIPLETDISLFVDPYALSIENDEWFAECNNLVVDYFQLVVDSIKGNDLTTAKRLLFNLHEPNDTHLGLSNGKPSGRGVGPIQAIAIFEQLKNSKAVLTGKLEDLSDCELLIPGISNDKISDITINIIRSKLLEYTEAQCKLHDIETVQKPSGFYWDSDSSRWRNRYVNLPVYNNERILLVPKAAIRVRLTNDYQAYYKHFVLEYLQAEHLHAGSSLVETLKNGKRVVYKYKVEEENPLSKEFLFEFSEEHPEVLERYKKSLPSIPLYTTDEQIERKQLEPRIINIENLIEDLDKITKGTDSANQFHNYIIGALETIFFPALRKPVKEQKQHDGRKRVDIVFNNGADRGFFFDLTAKHKIKCPYIFFECKNYSSDLKNPEFDQLTGRFGDKKGNFGILVCRKNDNKKLLLQSQKDIIHDNRGFVLVLDDNDIKNLIKIKSKQERNGIDDYLDNLFRQIIM